MKKLVLNASLQAKLDQNQYATIEDIKKDLFLMCDNATLYNKAKSQVHADALRLRKVTEMHLEPRAKREPESTPGRTSTRGSKGGPAALQQAQSSIVEDLLNLKNPECVNNPLPAICLNVLFFFPAPVSGLI
jgi:hypothetical protein